MKEKKTLAQKLFRRIKRSATKVNPRAKKSFQAALKGRGMSKARIKTASQKAETAARAAAKPKAEKTAAERIQRAVRIGGSLRVTPRKKTF